MESLPVEVLHRIFRLLPPATFYSVIPILSRSFRNASHSAIPGCPDGLLAIDCTVRLRREKIFLGVTPDPLNFKSVFEESSAGRDGTTIWAFADMDVDLEIEDIVNYSGGDVLEELSRRKMIKSSPRLGKLFAVNRNEVYFVFKHVNFSLVHPFLFHSSLDSRSVSIVVGEIISFVDKHRVRDVTCRQIQTCFEMEKWHPGRVMAGVTILRTTNIRLDEVMPISAFAATLEILLRMFPNADTLETEIRVFSTSAADKLIRCIPDARRRKITSLRDWSRIPLDFDDTSGSLNILHLARVFPNLQRLSHVRLSSTYSSSITSLEPLASESPQSIQFDHLESITIEIDSTNALDFVKVGLSSKRVSLILDGLANHAPLLKEVVLILKLFICPGEPLDEPNAAILAVADQLFVTAVTRPTFVIQEVIESIDHQTEIFETKRETLEGCREDKTKMLILDLEKLAVKRGVFWRWLRR